MVAVNANLGIFMNLCTSATRGYLTYQLWEIKYKVTFPKAVFRPLFTHVCKLDMLTCTRRNSDNNCEVSSQVESIVAVYESDIISSKYCNKN